MTMETDPLPRRGGRRVLGLIPEMPEKILGIPKHYWIIWTAALTCIAALILVIFIFFKARLSHAVERAVAPEIVEWSQSCVTAPTNCSGDFVVFNDGSFTQINFPGDVDAMVRGGEGYLLSIDHIVILRERMEPADEIEYVALSYRYRHYSSTTTAPTSEPTEAEQQY